MILCSLAVLCILLASAQSQDVIFRLGVLMLKESVFSEVRRFYQRSILNDTVSAAERSGQYGLEAELLVEQKPSPKALLEVTCKRLVAQNVTAIVVLADDLSVYKYFVSFSASMGIPVISWNPKVPVNKGLDNMLLLSPTMHHQAAAMISILKHYKWEKLAVISADIPESRYFVTALKIIISDDENRAMEIVSTHLLRQDDSLGMHRSLQLIKMSEARVILLHVNEVQAERVMEDAKYAELTTSEYVWIGTTAVVGNSIGSQTKALPQGMLGLRIVSPPSSLTTHKIMVPKAAIMLSAVKLWTDSIARFYKTESYRKQDLLPSLSCTSNNTFWPGGSRLYKHLKETSLRELNIQIRNSKDISAIATMPLTFNEDGTNKNVTLEIMNIGRSNVWRKIGYWKSPDTIELDDITWPGNSAKPPNGKPEKIFLKITTHDEMPYVNYFPPDPVTGLCNSIGAVRVRMTNVTEKDCPECLSNSSYFNCATGFCIDLLQKLKGDMNFDFEMFHVRDDKWGIPNENNEWNGLVKDLIDGVADISMTSLKIVPDRNSVIDFSVPFLETGITILVSIRQGVVSPTAFLEPYDYLSWLMALAVSVHLTGLAMCAVEYYSPYGLNRGKACGGHKFSFFRSLWLIWAILFSAAVKTDSTKGLASRFMTAVWALFSLVFLASYTANLAAFMITKEEFFNLEGIQDPRLTQPYTMKPPFRFATVPDGSTALNLKKYYPDMYQYMVPYNKESVDQGIEALTANEIHAFIYDATVLDYKATHDETCKLKTVGNWYAMTGYGIGFPKNSKYKEMFNIQLVKYINEGYLDRLRNFWLAGACKKSGEKSGSSRALEIINFTSAYILLAVGVLLAIALLLCEHFYFKFCRRKLRRIDKWGCCQLVSLSMGKSLTFEASVMEMIDATHHHRCKDAMCSNQQWRLQHELDLAILQIEKLQQKLARRTMIPRKLALTAAANTNSRTLSFANDIQEEEDKIE